MAQDIKDSIYSLSKGEKSKLHIGSRATPHRLRKEERSIIERALKKGFLELYPWSRHNPENIYLKTCIATQKKPVVCWHRISHSEVISYIVPEYEIDSYLLLKIKTISSKTIRFRTRKEAKHFAAQIAFS